MALYKIWFTSANPKYPVSPSLDAYNGLTRKYRNAIVLQLRRACWTLAKARGMLDCQISQDMKAWCDQVELEHLKENERIITFVALDTNINCVRRAN
jgi:hypothetical protein